MAGQILVALQRKDRIEEIVPYVEKIAQPGTTVVFLICYPVDGFGWLRAYITTMETGIRAAIAAQTMAEGYSMEEQRRMATQKISPAADALQKKGLEITVDVYSGSLRKVVRRYMLNGDVHLIMQRAGNGHPLVNLLRWTTDPFGLFKRPSFSPVLLLHPDQRG